MSHNPSQIALRQRWEFASILNFLKVFQAVIENNLNLSAEDIETALINPNDSIAQLHLLLLKGIPPVSRTLNNVDNWVLALSKKLVTWWPWVAEGEFPFAAAKGEEKSRYNELDPTVRLMILKALCEIRADQDDIMIHINESINEGTDVTAFRKENIGGDGNGTAFWYDGDSVIGHRLYKEVIRFESKSKAKGKTNIPQIDCQWETLATNLEEFRKVVNDFSSSKVKHEIAVSEVIESEAIAVLEKIKKKKEMAAKKCERQEILLNGFRTSGITRSCRNRGPVRYTFDEYDKAIDEALHSSKKIKPSRKQVVGKKPIEDTKDTKENKKSSNGDTPNPKAKSESDEETTENENQSDNSHQEDEDNVAEDTSDDQYEDNNDDNESNENVSNTSSSDNESDDDVSAQPKKQVGRVIHKPRGSRWSERVAGKDDKKSHFSPQNRLRQRPTRNTALDSEIVLDTEDENESWSEEKVEDDNEESENEKVEDNNEESEIESESESG